MRTKKCFALFLIVGAFIWLSLGGLYYEKRSEYHDTGGNYQSFLQVEIEPECTEAVVPGILMRVTCSGPFRIHIRADLRPPSEYAALRIETADIVLSDGTIVDALGGELVEVNFQTDEWSVAKSERHPDGRAERLLAEYKGSHTLALQQKVGAKVKVNVHAVLVDGNGVETPCHFQDTFICETTTLTAFYIWARERMG